MKQIPTVPVDKFKFCFAYWGAVADGRTGELFNPKRTAFDNESNIVLTDHPLNRGSLAIQKHCDSPEEFTAVMYRIFALAFLFQKNMGPFVRTIHNEQQVHESVLELAATFPLTTRSLRFDHRKFLRALNALTREYRHLAGAGAI